MSLRLRVQHVRFRHYVDAHVDAELQPRLATILEGHIAQCAPCAAVADVTVLIKRRLSRRGSTGLGGSCDDQ